MRPVTSTARNHRALSTSFSRTDISRVGSRPGLLYSCWFGSAGTRRSLLDLGTFAQESTIFVQFDQIPSPMAAFGRNLICVAYTIDLHPYSRDYPRVQGVVLLSMVGILG